MLHPNSISNIQPFLALIACGGESTRMKQDKSLLVYHRKPQRYYIYDLLSRWTDELYLSVNASQASSVEKGYRYITDLPVYQNRGPMSAVLTAWSVFPEHHILLIGCDYPFVDDKELHRFLSTLQPGVPAAFFNESTDSYEPLLAWYPYSHANQIRDQFRKGNYSLRQFLVASDADRYYPANTLCLFSANTPDDYQQVLKLLNKA